MKYRFLCVHYASIELNDKLFIAVEVQTRLMYRQISDEIADFVWCRYIS